MSATASTSTPTSTAVVPVDNLAKLNKFFLNEAGRDKFNKVIQYGSRFLMYHLLTSDPKSEYGLAFKSLFGLTRDCRKIVRLFKFLSEYEKIQVLLSKPTSQKQIIQIIGASGLSAYWFYDNLLWLAKGGMLKADENWSKLSMLGWWIGIVTSVIMDVQTLQESYESETKLRSKFDSTTDYADRINTQIQIDSLLSTRTNLYLNFVKNTGDFLISSNGWNLTKNVMGDNLNDGIVGLAGVISGSAVCASVWRGIK